MTRPSAPWEGMFVSSNLGVEDQPIYTTARLDVKTDKGMGGATGFMFQRRDRVFLVTNKHVIKDVKQGAFNLLAASKVGNAGLAPHHGHGLEVEFQESDFLGHPDPDVDIAVANITDTVNLLVQKGTPREYTLDHICVLWVAKGGIADRLA